MIKFLKNNSGATSIEYAVIASLVSIVIIAGAGVVGQESKENFDYVADSMEDAFHPASGEEKSE